jgi:hypothetical protein
MEDQMHTLANMGLLSRFVGMLTDSRSFLSYPRHEYFRRVLCNLLGGDVEAGLLPSDLGLLGKMVEDISFNNAGNYFPMECDGRRHKAYKSVCVLISPIGPFSGGRNAKKTRPPFSWRFSSSVALLCGSASAGPLLGPVLELNLGTTLGQCRAVRSRGREAALFLATARMRVDRMWRCSSSRSTR